jgi:hypothetical protein
MPDLGIIFQYYDGAPADVVTQNLSSLIHYSNGKYPIIPLKRTEGQSAWRNGDLGMFHWYQQRKVECARWLYLEWDAYCCQSIEDFFKPVWSDDISAPNIALPNNGWHWFCEIGNLPTQAIRENACGVWPMCAVMMSDKAMNVLSKTIINEPWPVISELRVGTAAKMNGFIIKEHPYSKYTIKWYVSDETNIAARYHRSGIWHPIKTLVNDDIPKRDINSLDVFVWPDKEIGFYE